MAEEKDEQKTNGVGEDVEIEVEEPASPSPTSETSAENVESLKRELEKAKNEHLYLMAEFDNYRKRAIKERSEYMKYAGERALVAILEVLDNFERALQVEVTPDNIESYKKGVILIADELRNTLKRFGIQEIPSENAQFDPNIHEALGTEQTDQVQPGHVSKVFRKAYKFHDKVVRPAQVIVAKEKSAET